MAELDVTEAVVLLRRVGLAPTRLRVVVAAVAFSGATIPGTVEELRERAMDFGVCLSREAAAEGLADLRRAGLLPEFVRAPRPLADATRRAARIFQAMGNPHRLAVLRELTCGERSAGELQRVVGLRAPALSQHLSRLKAEGLVRCRRAGTRIFYALAGEDAGLVLRSLTARSGITA